MLFRQAANTFGWSLNNGAIALMWKGGCIIRRYVKIIIMTLIFLYSAFLGDIKRAFDHNPELKSLLFDNFFRDAIGRCQASWRLVLAEAIMLGIPTPALSTAMAFYDAYRCESLPANLLQAQRDYFGAHTFEFSNEPGHFYHVNWTGLGGSTSSTNYQA